MDIYAAALSGMAKLGAKRIRGLVTYFGSAEKVWRASTADILEAEVLSSAMAAKLYDYTHSTDLDRLARELREKNVSVLTWQEEGYPPLLKETANPPAVLFYRGAKPVWEKTIAIVGARKATAYGVNAAKAIAEGLGREGVTIVSGGARGIDTIAHEGCLLGGAPTAAVLACGLDVTYPPENRNLFQKICDAGGTLLSEYPLGTEPLGRQFPARNRIIAGMTRGVVVTEAAMRSGSLITADFALEEGRDVFSVPGSIWSAMSKGTNHLIRNGAICATGAGDILSEYGWNEEKTEESKKIKTEELTLEEEMVYRFCCTGDTVSGEDLLVQSGFTVPKLTMICLSLTMKGYIREAGAGLYAACK